MNNLTQLINQRNKLYRSLATVEASLKNEMEAHAKQLARELIALHPSAENKGTNPDGQPVVHFFSGKLLVLVKVFKITSIPSRNIKVWTEYEVSDFSDENTGVDTIKKVKRIIERKARELPC